MTILQEQIDVSRPVHEVFTYVADFTTTREWDSTATAAEKLTPGPVDVGTRFAVTCAAPVGSIKLVYEVTRLETDRGITLRGSSRFFTIEDRITFTPTGTGTRIDSRALRPLDMPNAGHIQVIARSAHSHRSSSMVRGRKR